MSRPPLAPPPMTYQQWVAAGHPPLSLSIAQMAPWLEPPLSGQAIRNAVELQKMNKDGKYIHTADARNFQWIKDREGIDPTQHKGRPRGQTQPARQAVAPPPAMDYGDHDDQLDLQEILNAIEHMDLRKLSNSAVQKIRGMEAALKVRVEREMKRGQLIDRTLVTTVFSRLYQIDSNELRTLGAKLSPELCGKLGIEEPGAQLEVEKMIDNEVLKVLAHIKRLIDKFLGDIA